MESSNPILSLNPEVSAECFKDYLKELRLVFNKGLSQPSLKVFANRVDRLKKRLGLPGNDITYQDLRILEDENALKVLSYIALFKNSQIVLNIQADYTKNATKISKVSNNLLLYKSNSTRNEHVNLLKTKNPSEAEELRRDLIIYLWIQALLYDLTIKITPYYDMVFHSFEHIDSSRFQYLDEIKDSRVFKAAFNQILGISEENLNRAIEIIKQNSYFINKLPESIYSVSFIGNKVFMDEAFDWLNKEEEDANPLQACFLIKTVYELGHLAYRINDEKMWYEQAPFQTTKWINSEYRRDSDLTPFSLESKPLFKKRKLNSRKEAKIPVEEAKVQSESNEMLIERRDNEVGNYAETVLFGFRLKGTNRHLADLILDRKTWDSTLEKFHEKILRYYILGNYKVNRGIRLGRCGRAPYEGDPAFRSYSINK